MKKVLWMVVISSVLVLFSGCADSNVNADSKSYTGNSIERSYWPTEEWQTAAPQEHNMDPGLINELTQTIKKDDIYTMLIVKDGYIVSEYYKNGYKKESNFRFDSCTKSITSALVGIAIDKGYIKNVDVTLPQLYPDYPELNNEATDERKREITIKNLLNATSGINWPEWGSWNYGIGHMVQSKDWVKFILGRDMEEEPSKKFNYSTGDAHLLSSIVTKSSGKDTLTFARENLFSPMGISKVRWLKEPGGIYAGGHGIELNARDAAKFGFLYLNKGIWDGTSVVPKNWVEDSTKKQSEGSEAYGSFGYQWWIRTFKVENKAYNSYFAMGYGGQYIFVVPEADLVVVFASWLPGDESFKPIKYMETHILKALK